MQYEEGTKLQILSPVVKNEKGTHKDLLAKILSSGFERVRVDGVVTRIPEVEDLEKNKRHNIEIVVDRVIVRKDQRSRIAEAIELACDWSKGYCVFLTEKEERLFSQHHSCPECGFSVPDFSLTVNDVGIFFGHHFQHCLKQLDSLSLFAVDVHLPALFIRDRKEHDTVLLRVHLSAYLCIRKARYLKLFICKSVIGFFKGGFIQSVDHELEVA